MRKTGEEFRVYAPVCPLCRHSLYRPDEALFVDGRMWHAVCFRWTTRRTIAHGRTASWTNAVMASIRIAVWPLQADDDEGFIEMTEAEAWESLLRDEDAG